MLRDDRYPKAWESLKEVGGGGEELHMSDSQIAKDLRAHSILTHNCRGR